MRLLLPWIMLVGCLEGVAFAGAGPEGQAVEEMIREAAKAAATYSETRDRQTVLKLYAQDYEGAQDGETETKAAIEKWLDEYESELQRGSRLRFIGSVSNLKTGVAESLAWATYDYLFQAIRNGELEGHDAGKCTALLRKEGSSWLIFHEHCSKPRTGSAK